MIIAVTTLLLLAARAGTADTTEKPLACNLAALTQPERLRHRALMVKITSAIDAREDLTDGLALRLCPSKITIREVAEWIDLESRCCPFLNFGLDLSDRGDLKLSLTGPPAAKSLLQSELAKR